jgi:hypothetical protein
MVRSDLREKTEHVKITIASWLSPHPGGWELTSGEIEHSSATPPIEHTTDPRME